MLEDHKRILELPGDFTQQVNLWGLGLSWLA